MSFTERERVALALAMQHPNQVITEEDIDIVLKRTGRL